MGHLLFIDDSFETLAISGDEREIALRDFCKALNLAFLDKDSIYAVQEFFSRNYSYGNMIYELPYLSWGEFCQKASLVGISPTTFNLFQTLFYILPGRLSALESLKKFTDSYHDTHNGFTGFKNMNEPEPYVSCENTWKEWKKLWLQLHQKEIDWEKSNDNFLPNVTESNKILLEELRRHEKEHTLIKYDGRIGIAFHEEVLKKKGHETEAYTIEIGRRVSEANFYLYDELLSQNERNIARSLRTIFKLIGKEGEYQYISLDHKHGMFEYHDAKGTHLGEYKFDGSYTSAAQADHNLKTIK